MVPTRVSNVERARKHSGVFVDLYCDCLMRGDALADSLVIAMDRLPRGEGMKMFELTLEKGLEAVRNPPLELVEFVAESEAIPEWVDWDRLARGARTYQRTGVGGAIALSAVSLMNGYHSNAAIKPLLFTGRLDQTARRRLAETGRFIYETIQVNGLRRHSRGFKTTLRVRLIHAFVRHMLTKSPKWSSEAWGVPINQADMAATNLSFSIALIYALREMGYRFSRSEADDLVHLWRYSGYLSGVDVGLLATTEEEAWYRAELIDMLQPGPDEGSTMLAAALRKVNDTRPGTVQRLTAPLLARYHDGVTRVVIGDEKADALGTPHAQWAHVVRGMKHFVNATELVRERLPFGTRLAAMFGNRMWQSAIELELEGKDADFAPPHAVPYEGRFAAHGRGTKHATIA